jgi:Ran GTPase-activating protein (RanGAP) involved in mRNA processing and transport
LLDISGCAIDARGALMLATVIGKTLIVLEGIKANGCQLGNKGVISLLESTRDKKNFTTLELADTKITDQATTYLGRYLTENRIIKHLNLSNNKLDTKGIELIFKSLEGNQKYVYDLTMLTFVD